MSIASIIGGIVVGGVIVGVVGYFGYYALKPLFSFFSLRREVPRARVFLKQLNKRFPPGKLSDDLKVEREKAMIESGFSPRAISIAQNQKPDEVSQLVEWFQEAIEKNGMTIFEAEQQLIQNGWKQKHINKAKKKLFKLNSGAIQNAKAGRTIPRLPGTEPGDNARDGTRADGNGDEQVEHKRILPLSKPLNDERDKSNSANSEPNSEWDWSSFK